jgi:hypothetical protein
VELGFGHLVAMSLDVALAYLCTEGAWVDYLNNLARDEIMMAKR